LYKDKIIIFPLFNPPSHKACASAKATATRGRRTRQVGLIPFICNVFCIQSFHCDSYCTTKDESAKRMKAVLVINATHDAYQNKKYLEEDGDINIPINQTLVTGDNVFVGNNYGNLKQQDNIEESDKNPIKSSGKPKWLKWAGWILGILVLIIGLIEAIRRILFT
jgi:hypothetical protein